MLPYLLAVWVLLSQVCTLWWLSAKINRLFISKRSISVGRIRLLVSPPYVWPLLRTLSCVLKKVAACDSDRPFFKSCVGIEPRTSFAYRYDSFRKDHFSPYVCSFFLIFYRNEPPRLVPLMLSCQQPSIVLKVQRHPRSEGLGFQLIGLRQPAGRYFMWRDIRHPGWTSVLTTRSDYKHFCCTFAAQCLYQHRLFASHSDRSMSAILSADDLNDFISPGVACIKPVETLPKQAPERINVCCPFVFLFPRWSKGCRLTK